MKGSDKFSTSIFITKVIFFLLIYLELSDHLKIKFDKRWQDVTNNLQIAAQVGNDP